MGMSKKAKSVRTDCVTREYTVNLHKRLHSSTFKKRAPRAIRAIRKFAAGMMGTEDVRVPLSLTKPCGARVSRTCHTVSVFAARGAATMTRTQRETVHHCDSRDGDTA